MHLGMAIDAPGMTIAASLDGDHFLPGWQSMHPGMVFDASGGGDLYTTRDGVAASQDCDRCIPGWRSMDPGMVIMHPRMAIIASRDGDLEMTIDASRDGDRSIPGWRSMHPGMAIYHCNPGWRSLHPGMEILR